MHVGETLQRRDWLRKDAGLPKRGVGLAALFGSPAGPSLAV